EREVALLDLLVELGQQLALLDRLAGQLLEVDHEPAGLGLELDLLERLDLARGGDADGEVAALDLDALRLDLLLVLAVLGLEEEPPGAAGDREAEEDEEDLHQS